MYLLGFVCRSINLQIFTEISRFFLHQSPYFRCFEFERSAVPPLQQSKISSQSKKSSLRQFLPERTVIDKFEGRTFNINVFCGDQSKIARPNKNWSLSDQGTSRNYLDCSGTFWSFFMNCGFNHKLFHWSCIENSVFIHWRSLYKAGLWTVVFVPFGLETSDIRKPAKGLSPRREANKIIYVFDPLLNCLAI